MPRIYKGGAAQVAVMYYPCVVNPSSVEDLKITLYSEGNKDGITYMFNEIAIDNNSIAVVSVSKSQLDTLNDGVIKYISEGVVDGRPFIIDRYSSYYVHTPSEYNPSTDGMGYVTFDDLSETLNGYITEDELQEQLKNIDSVPYIVVNEVQFEDGSWGYGISNGDFDNVLNAIVNKTQYQIFIQITGFRNSYYIPSIVALNNSKDAFTVNYFSHFEINKTRWGQFYISKTSVERVFEESVTLQEKLVSGTNIKTINGNSLLGSGDITIEGGGADVDLSDYVTKDELNKKGYITGIPSEYVTETELNSKGYATTASVNNKQDKLTSGSNIKTINNTSVLGSGNISVQPTLVSGTNIKTINGNSLLGSGNITIKTDVDLSGYVTTDALNSKGYLTSVPSEYITETELSGMGYATQSYVDTQVGDIETILDNIIGNK